ncbi:hypothetical protein MVEN_01359800 [Mycena venus]|uniref:Uncharacterized protein n=1 Tax=Mycena venus TaxID=2733690 RepID=A0A8H6Y236_9AGAR|nr:hypothetical protein MVEN_01359800 [Mycena venus]
MKSQGSDQLQHKSYQSPYRGLVPGRPAEAGAVLALIAYPECHPASRIPSSLMIEVRVLPPASSVIAYPLWSHPVQTLRNCGHHSFIQVGLLSVVGPRNELNLAPIFMPESVHFSGRWEFKSGHSKLSHSSYSMVGEQQKLKTKTKVKLK